MLVKYAIFRQELEQNNASKQKVGHCDKTTLQIFFFIFTILITYVSLIFHSKIQPKISGSSGKEIDFVVFAVFSSLSRRLRQSL